MMNARMLSTAFLACTGLFMLVAPVCLQGQRPEETLSGPDMNKTIAKESHVRPSSIMCKKHSEQPINIRSRKLWPMDCYLNGES